MMKVIIHHLRTIPIYVKYMNFKFRRLSDGTLEMSAKINPIPLFAPRDIYRYSDTHSLVVSNIENPYHS